MGLRERAQERRETQAHAVEAGTPVGQARAARERGDGLLQIAVPMTEARQLLPDIAREGWTLVTMSAAWSFTQDVEYLNGISKVGGRMMGYYVFAPAGGAPTATA